MTEDQKVGVIANAIGWVMLGQDGREVSEAGEIQLTKSEVLRCHAAANLVFEHLKEFEEDE